MKKYIWVRVFKSILSILIVTAIVIAMVFTMIPKEKIFENDTNFRKLTGNLRVQYYYTTLKNLGYLDHKRLGELCSIEGANSKECHKSGSVEQKKVFKMWEDKGYKIHVYDKTGDNLYKVPFAIREYSAFELVYKYFSNMFRLDHPRFIKDKNNPELDKTRGYYIGRDHNGLPALMCTGCQYKYQVYVNSKFPFIHSNIFGLNFGNSFPSNPGTPTISVITNGQGKQVRTDKVYPTGYKTKSADDLHSLRYKYNIDHLDEKKFKDHYATVDLVTDSPSMIGTSYIFGIIALILSYILAIPFGVAMARNQGKWVDKIGIFYINLLIAIPSLALIFVLKYFGTFFSLPDKFPQFGAGDYRSYIMPIIVMTILGMPGLMVWIRRYMIDQSTSDYVKFAKAKGLSAKEISMNHILKNAIIPIVNGIPGAIVLQIGGAIYTETIFAIPGMGKMFPDAINSANNNMIIALTFIFTALSIFSLFAGDILLTWVDPRISLSAKKGDV